jgi:hypothetical protein
METKKLYNKPEIETVVLNMPASLLAGGSANTNPSGQNWEEDEEP